MLLHARLSTGRRSRKVAQSRIVIARYSRKSSNYITNSINYMYITRLIEFVIRIAVWLAVENDLTVSAL